jgi:hypothetical protein
MKELIHEIGEENVHRGSAMMGEEMVNDMDKYYCRSA